MDVLILLCYYVYLQIDVLHAYIVHSWFILVCNHHQCVSVPQTGAHTSTCIRFRKYGFHLEDNTLFPECECLELD